MVKSRNVMPVTDMIGYTLRNESNKYKTLSAKEIHDYITKHIFPKAKYDTVRRTLDLMATKEKHIYSWIQRVGESQYQYVPTQDTRIVLFD